MQQIANAFLQALYEFNKQNIGQHKIKKKTSFILVMKAHIRVLYTVIKWNTYKRTE